MSISSPRPPVPLTPSKFNTLCCIQVGQIDAVFNTQDHSIPDCHSATRLSDEHHLQTYQLTPLLNSTRHGQLPDTQRRLFFDSSRYNGL